MKDPYLTMCIVVIVCLNFGMYAGKHKMQRECIEAGVAQYNPTNQNFEFIKVNQ